jgi:ribosomal-protein-alanine N-acetyltransferase
VTPIPPIASGRLTLVSLGPLELRALLIGDRHTAGERLHCEIPADLALEEMPLAMRLAQIEADPAVQPWLLRAIVLRESRTMIGHINFHTAPRPDYLAAIAPDGVELGYSIQPRFRRRGLATESVLALMHWAHTVHEQRCFVLSISPENVPSLRMAQNFGFVKVGSHIDEEDGLELEFMRRFDTWPVDWREGART